MAKIPPAQVLKDKPQIKTGRGTNKNKPFVFQISSRNDVQTYLFSTKDLNDLLQGWGFKIGG